ncbi:MAG: hypothetical protein M1837_003785 [Sclerophora amabilis]|nr:MAG: hypothetical protein M1837_003785 [Sclerophora amabilis]
MGLNLAPYNNGMRIGQGFNSYTQQIRIDDAVVIDPDRAENVLTNDGSTMRILAESLGKPSAWRRQPEVLVEPAYVEDKKASTDDVGDGQPAGGDQKAISPPDEAATGATETTGAKAEETPGDDSVEEALTGEETSADAAETEESSTDVKAKEAKTGTSDSRDSAVVVDAPEKVPRQKQLAKDKKAEQDKAKEDEARRKRGEKNTAEAADKYKSGYSKQELEKMGAPIKFESRGTGLGSKASEFTFDETKSRGPSQIVSYSSKFVDKLSDITDDMNISGSLSIKYGTIGGSGRGAFIDSDKFKESDLNFYISVKVVNQSVNFKDALQYQPLASVNEKNHTDVYGDSFISGFLEGGEFNALVSMKVLNKAKKTDIQAEAKVALTAAGAEISAEANVKLAKTNINTNTETTIQVSWCGGGHIKHLDEQWDIDSLIRTAARFPDLVADAPQRTYAILTNYDTLRSFVARKPVNLNPLPYENATLYTNALLDSYMSYKSVYKKIGTDMFDIQNETKQFKRKTTSTTEGATESAPAVVENAPSNAHFAPTLQGLEEARVAARRQMNAIVREVDLMTKHPELATDEKHKEPFESPVAFQTRIPAIEPTIAHHPPKVPLSGAKIAPVEPVKQAKPGLPDLYAPTGTLSSDENDKIATLQKDRVNLSEHLRLTAPVGSYTAGTSGRPFCNLDFMQPDFVISSISVEIYAGVVAALTVVYTNGLVLTRGKSRSRESQIALADLGTEERIIAGSIETGVPATGSPEPRVTSLKLYTNRGRGLLGQAKDRRFQGGRNGVRDGIEFKDLLTTSWDTPIADGYVKGFWGRSDESLNAGGIWRLGFIWGNTAAAGDVAATIAAQSSSDPTPPQSGVVSARDFGTMEQQNFNIRVPIKFPTPLPNVPRMIFGLNLIDTLLPSGPRVASDAIEATREGFVANPRSFDGSVPFDLKMSWLTLPDNDVHFETGIFDTYDVRTEDTQNVSQRIFYSKPFAKNPVVVCWFFEVNIATGWRSLKTFESRVGKEAFTLNVHTWADRRFGGARVGWLAYDADENGKRVKSGSTETRRNESGVNDSAWNSSPFSTTPATFIALSELDISDSHGFRAKAEVNGVTKDRLSWTLNTWADTDMDHIKGTWIEIEQ